MRLMIVNLHTYIFEKYSLRIKKTPFKNIEVGANDVIFNMAEFAKFTTKIK